VARGVGVRTDYAIPGYSDRFAKSRYLTLEQYRFWVSELARITAARDCNTVIDVGAGTGRFLPVLREACGPQTLVALDKSRAMLNQIPGDQALRVVADINDLPLRAGSADVCFVSMVLHYASDPVRALRALAAATAAEGLLIVRMATSSTLRSFDFLRFFPSALAAETEVMPAHDHV
jgi:ubiquinone/menaquinone biosynthesis C-methylase UbiE